jgi:hypothetical protein
MAKGYNPKFQINLNQIFNKAFADDARLRDAVRPTLSSGLFRSTFGQAVMERIIKRTLDGIDRNGIQFQAYSKSYRNSDVFKIYAKNPGEVNLKLSGEMLASLVSKGSGPLISIELIGEENKAKAHGHVFGIRTKGNGRVKRDFLGLPDDELVEIMQASVRIARNDAVQAAVEYFDNTSFAEFFGQVGAQAEFNTTIFTPEVLAILAEGL